jgi:hypothetical protein
MEIKEIRSKVLDDHICRFNDGEQLCYCFTKGFDAGFHTLLQSEIERLETEKIGQNVIINKIARAKYKEANHDNGYNQALTDTITHYKKLQESINKEI